MDIALAAVIRTLIGTKREINPPKLKRYSRMRLSRFLLALFFIVFFENAFAGTYEQAVSRFKSLTSDRMAKLKEGSKPIVLGQGKKTKTVLLFHGLSDSPGSMMEIAQVYFKHNYNVVMLLLRDHGLLAPYRNIERDNITYKKWREDISMAMEAAMDLSNDSQISIAAYSLGGVLATDVIDRYPGHVKSIVYVTPMFQIYENFLASMTKYLKYVVYADEKGVPETPHFYPDITLNQTQHAYFMSQYVHKFIVLKKRDYITQIPKMMFLTDADTTVSNEAAYETAALLSIPQQNIILYENHDPNNVVLHRDLPMKYINANGHLNPFLQDMLQRIGQFLEQVDRVD
ncbi:MAG: alpha/beta hydrolase [Bdellovibrio sp.]